MEMESCNMLRAIAPTPLASASTVLPNHAHNARPSVSALWEPAPVTNWTVKDAGGTIAPTSNNYDLWNIHQLRRESTARGKKIKRTIDDEGGVRRCWLREDDLRRHPRAAMAAPPVPIPIVVSSAAGKSPTPAQHRNAPVVHVITLDKPVAVAPIDRLTLKDSMTQTIGVKRKQRKNDGGVEDGAAHSLLRMPRVVPRELMAPHYMPSPSTGAPSRLSASTLPVQVSTPAKPRGVLEILDCLSKTYAIRAQLQTALGGAEQHDRPDPFLQQSIELVEAGLRVLEQEYAIAMGIVYPHNKKGTEDVSRLRLGMTFETAKSLVKYVKAYSSRLNKEIRVDHKRKGGTMRVLLCTDEMCPFKLVAYKSESASAGDTPWYISSLQADHRRDCTSKARIPSRRTEYRRLRAAIARDPSGAARVSSPTDPRVAAQITAQQIGIAGDPSVAAPVPAQQIGIARDPSAAAPVSAPANPRGVLEILDCLSKTYAIRAQLRTAMGGDDENDRPDPFLQQSIELVEKGLRVVEQEYAVAMGITNPDS